MADQEVSVDFAQRLVSDMPGDFGAREVSPVYMDGVDIDVLRAAINNADFRAGQRQAAGSRFWATPARLQSDLPIRDIIEIDLAVSRLVNTVSFDLAHFPHRAEVEYSTTSNQNDWQPLRDSSGKAIVIETVDSNPPILAQNATQNLAHPHHFGAGHWMSQHVRLLPVSAIRFRIVLTRPNGGVPPTDSQGTAVPYSLGVRSFVVGYDIETEADIPTRPLVPGSRTTYQPIESTRDLLGSSVSYAKRENPAANLRTGGIWRCEPQPLPYAVVNLYLDVRSISNNPTVIDRIFVDPVSSGCSVNLYYTIDTPDFTQPDPWIYVVWTSVGRDFALRRGFMRFAPTRATFFKMEFTDLAPEPYDSNQAIVRTVKMFPGGLESQDPISRSGNTGGAGTVVNVAHGALPMYDDGNDTPVTRSLTDLSRGYSPTEVFYSKDPAAAGRLADLSEFYNYMPWQGGTQAPHWPGTQTHPYVETEVLHDHRVAFFVALANVTPYRLDYAFEEDTDQYLEHFFDATNFENRGWIQRVQDVKTPHGAGPYRLTSKVFKSRTNVRGVQFATTQSPPLQLLPDDDFNSGVVEGDQAHWIPISSDDEADPYFAVSSEFSTDIGTTVQIRREGATEVAPRFNLNLYREISRNYGTYGEIMRQGLTYADLARTPTLAEQARFGGIKSRRPITPAYGARIYAAARVFSKIDLGEPVWIQIFDELANDGKGAVVSETPATVQANKIVEWYTSYDAGTLIALGQRTWSQVSQSYPTYSAMDSLAYDTVATMVGDAKQVRLTARLVQKGVANASFFADTVSLFEESILWEFSNDGGLNWYSAPGIRNNPNGVLLFPAPNETAYRNTYEAIEGQDPRPTHPTYNQFQATRWSAMEHAPRSNEPNRRELRWRVTCARGGQHVNGLSIRPWYVGQARGVLPHEGVDIAGPNVALYDHFAPIEMDPRWRLWHKPIPQAWYFFYRQFTLLRHDDYVQTAIGTNTVLPESFVVPRVGIVPSTDVLGDALILPVGGPTPPPQVPFTGVLVDAFILRST